MIVYMQCIGHRNLVYKNTHIESNKIQLSDLLDYIRTELQLLHDASIVVKHKTRTLELCSSIDDGMRLVVQIIKNPLLNEPPNESPLKQSNNQQKCKNKCGFYANGTSEYCSKCDKCDKCDKYSSQNNETSNDKQKTINQTTNQITNQTQCNVCHKKIGLLGFLCKCGFKYCGLHRQPEQHECTFDYVSKKRSELQDQLVKCDKNKINKI